MFGYTKKTKYMNMAIFTFSFLTSGTRKPSEIASLPKNFILISLFREISPLKKTPARNASLLN
jgi:hypothetical protein